MTSLVVQTSFIGDMVLTTPLIAELARRGPVDVLTTPITAPLLANNPAVRRVILYDKRGADRGAIGLWRAARSARELFKEGKKRPVSYDAAYLAQGSVRSAIVARLVGAKEYVGFSSSPGRPLYTRLVPYRDDKHHAVRLLLLARPYGREPTGEELVPSLYPGEAERIAVDGLLAAGGVAPGERLVALAPSSLWMTKRWPYYAELATQLASMVRIVVVGSANDTGFAQEILAGVPNAIDATGRLSPLASAELIRRCAAIVTNDSAPLHLASAVGTPTVAIFGPTVPAFGFGPLAPRSIVAGHETLTCRPCARIVPRVCPLGHFRCMRDLDVEQIAAHVRSLLDPVANR